MALDIKVFKQRGGRITHVQLIGQADTQQIAEKVESLIYQGNYKLVIDMLQLEDIDDDLFLELIKLKRLLEQKSSQGGIRIVASEGLEVPEKLISFSRLYTAIWSL